LPGAVRENSRQQFADSSVPEHVMPAHRAAVDICPPGAQSAQEFVVEDQLCMNSDRHGATDAVDVVG